MSEGTPGRASTLRLRPSPHDSGHWFNRYAVMPDCWNQSVSDRTLHAIIVRSLRTLRQHQAGPTDASRPVRDHSALRASVAIGLFCFVVYNLNFRSISAGDTYPARYIPFALWHWHTVLLDPIADIASQGWTPIKPRKSKEPPKSVDPQEAFWAVQLPQGHLVSLYPVTTPVLLSPLYLPAVAYLSATGWDPQELDRSARIMEKVLASLLASASAALFFLLVRRRADVRPALLLTFAYAFGTTTWVISSQALWQHGVAELLVVCALFLLTGECTRGRAVAAGLVLGLLACNRPPDAIIAAALGAYGLWWAARFAPLLVAAAVTPAVPLLAYNLGTVGHYAGAYGLVGDPSFFDHNVLFGLAGLLFSPTKGLFIFSPFLIFAAFCPIRMIRDKRARGIAIAALAAVVVQVLLYAAADWRQGGSWGPRWLTDLVPILVWMLAWIAPSLGGLRRAVFVLTVAAAITIEAIGAFWYTGASNAGVYASATEPNPMRSAWQFRNAPFIAELRHRRAPLELMASARGYLDVMTFGIAPKGREIELEGWALTSGRSPQEVIALLDGHPAASTSGFGPRPDVTRALGAPNPSGWSLRIPATNLSPEKHTVALLARAYRGGDTRLFAKGSLAGRMDLASAARRAAHTLAIRQQQPGYWLTSFTNQLRFEHPGVEMNTYLQAVMLDILNPVAKQASLEFNLDRARQFLTQQIEADGLVRYHGLPDAPTIGTLGCAITPDADDTALVWRIAPSARRELVPRALHKIAEYRTAAGLYRTWLAPKDRYQCIDPGSDPDPADFGIQMHVFLWLANVDRAAADAHCAALKRSVNDDRAWVYYKSAPLIPILRQADLRESGCSLRLPESRQKTTVPGQELWISAARLLDRARSGEGERPSPAEVRALLEEFSADDFLYVRRFPPLVYHNDQTASVPRFYWSEEYGYALWLRLYFELGAGGAN